MEDIGSRKGFLPGLFRKARKSAAETADNGLNPGPRKEFLGFMPTRLRNEFLAMAGEFVGTFLFLFVAFAGAQVAKQAPLDDGGNAARGQVPDTSQLLFIALSFGFSLTVNAWIFFRVTGGLFNPAVTLGLCLIGAVPFSRGVLVFIAQLLGAISASAVIRALYPGPLMVATTLGGGTTVVQGLFIEMFLTAQLVFTIFMLAAEKHKSTFLAPIGIGLSLFIGQLGGVFYTGASLNPARSFGPAVANARFESYHWIYWVGPVLGALIASGFFWFIKAAEYESVNPGQDFDDLEASAFDPEKDNNRPVVKATHDADGNDVAPESQYRRKPSDQPQYPMKRYDADEYGMVHDPNPAQNTTQFTRAESMGSNTLRDPSEGRSNHRRRSSQNYDRSQRPTSGHRLEVIGGPPAQR